MEEAEAAYFRPHVGGRSGFIPEYSCHIRERLGELIGGENIWWGLDVPVAELGLLMTQAFRFPSWIVSRIGRPSAPCGSNSRTSCRSSDRLAYRILGIVTTLAKRRPQPGTRHRLQESSSGPVECCRPRRSKKTTTARPTPSSHVIVPVIFTGSGPSGPSGRGSIDVVFHPNRPGDSSGQAASNAARTASCSQSGISKRGWRTWTTTGGSSLSDVSTHAAIAGQKTRMPAMTTPRVLTQT
jgi:hypothetical protein